MRGWWRDLTDLVLPAECGGCGRPRAVLCPECRAALTGAAPSRVRPVPEPWGLPVVHAAAPYEDAVRAMLLAHKERGALALAGPLGAALAGAVRVGVGRGGGGEGAPEESSVLEHSPVLLVPVPSSRQAVRARGHDPARRIALAAARELRRTGMPARVLGVLRQCRVVADQSGLDSRERLDNLAGALEVVAGGAGLLAGGRVVLVDDLMTTGASLAEAARAVRAVRAASGGMCAGSVDRGVAPVEGGPAAMGRDEVLVGRDVASMDRGVVPVGRGAASMSMGMPLVGRGAVPTSPVVVAAGRGAESAVPGVVSREARGVGRTAEEAPRAYDIRETVGEGDARGWIRAAVIAAPSDSFEINRN